MKVTFLARVPDGTHEVLIPGGLVTPHGTCKAVEVPMMTEVVEATTGQRAYRMVPVGGEISVSFQFEPTGGRYPEAVFAPHASRFTRFAEDLVAEVDEIVGDLTGLERARAVTVLPASIIIPPTLKEELSTIKTLRPCGGF